MAIDEKNIALINAAIDGELQPESQVELDAFLAASEEGRALDAELRSLCTALDDEKMLDPPQHLRHVIMNSIPEAVNKAKPQAEPPGFWQSLFVVPALRYALTFAAGVIMTVVIVDSSQIQHGAFDEVTGLVGTMTNSGDSAPRVDSVALHKAAVAGTVTLRNADPLLIIDFDLSTSGPVDIIASYEDHTVWFNGFAQLESTGTSISTQDGEVRIQLDGKRRYAVYLHNSGHRKLSINLQFFSNGEPVHEAVLEYDAN